MHRIVLVLPADIEGPARLAANRAPRSRHPFDPGDPSHLIEESIFFPRKCRIVFGKPRRIDHQHLVDIHPRAPAGS